MQEHFRDPVIAADRHTYERAAMESWLRRCQRTWQLTSPVTGAALPHAGLLPNRNITALLDGR
jgi:hypothetical protein